MWQNCKIQDVIPLANDQPCEEGRKNKKRHSVQSDMKNTSIMWKWTF